MALRIDRRALFLWHSRKRRGSKQAVPHAPDFRLVIDIRELIDGDQFGQQRQGGARRIVFELRALKLEPFAPQSDLLPRDFEKLAFDARVLLLIQPSRNRAISCGSHR
jgi:hypothetical protein